MNLKQRKTTKHIQNLIKMNLWKFVRILKKKIDNEIEKARENESKNSSPSEKMDVDESENKEIAEKLGENDLQSKIGTRKK